MMAFFGRTTSMANDERLTPDALAALRERFQHQSRKAQAYYTVMHEARRLVASDDAASEWMSQPLTAFDGKTPAQLVGEGREQEVLAHVRSLARGA
jgi:uncharacterized protein (DUF2384 family)